jgi:hypothetical protein
VSPRLVAVGAAAEAYAAVAAALAARNLRWGWLELADPEPLPPGLVAAAGGGALRAVAAGGAVNVALKRRRGAPVLRDLLREHFAGCAVVFVRGGDPSATPRLEPEGEEFRWTSAPGESRRLAAEAVAAALARRGAPRGPR